MRNPDRISKILNELGDIWRTYPDLRLGQLIFYKYQTVSAAPYYIEDEDFIKELKEFYFGLEK